MPSANRPDSPTIFGTGLLALDVIISADPHVPARLAAGGTCGNVLAILAYLGWHAYPVARLGDDPPAQRLLDDLAEAGVSLRFARQGSPAPTPIFVQTIRREGAGVPVHRFSTHCPSCGAWLPSYRAVTVAAVRGVTQALEEESCESPYSVFFFDRVSRGALILAEWFRSRGALVVFEPAGATSEPALFAEAVALTDVLKYSADRIKPDTRTACGASPRMLEVETRGAEGLRFRTYPCDTDWQVLPAIDAPYLVDTAGAGDWCTAGLLWAWYREQSGSRVDWEAALHFGQRLAALACAFEGARGLMGEMPSVQVLQWAATLGAVDAQGTESFDPARASRVAVPEPFACVLCEPVESGR